MTRRTWAVAMLLTLAAAMMAHGSRTEPVPIRQPLANMPMQLGSWQGQSYPDMSARVLAVLGVTDYINRAYRRADGSFVTLYVGYYQSQRQGESIHSPLNCLPGAGWNPAKRDTIRIPVSETTAEAAGAGRAKTRSIDVNLIVIQKGMEKQVVIYWYQTHGRVIANEYWGRIYTVIDALRRNRTDAALVRITSPVAGQEEKPEMQAVEASVQFVQELFPLLSFYLPN
jgi:EpsI family protein